MIDAAHAEPEPVPGQMTPIAMIRKEGLTAVFLAVTTLTTAYITAALVLGLSPLVAVALFAAGAFYWTFLEYLLHRFVLHWEPERPAYKAIRKCFPGHRAHHNRPSRFREDGLHMVKFIFAPSVFGIACFYAIFALVPGVGEPLAMSLVVVGGIQTGYLGYEFVHSACHFMPMRSRYAAHLKRHHAIHHHRDETVNFGVTTSVWDTAFRTTWRGKRAAHVRAAG